MAKALFVIYLIGLSIVLATAYKKECAVGPGYWCKSFENAQDCGAINHCTDTVWSNDKKYTSADSSTACQRCEEILRNIQQGLGDTENLMPSALIDGCKLLSSEDLSAKCVNVVENYETSVISLMKNKRYATLCHLMNMCSNEKPPVIVGSKRCTWGPSYWCSSLSDARECNSIEHCSNQIWSQQEIKKKENDNICQYCEFIIDELRSFITENKTEINIEQWLSGACKMLQTKDAIDECVKTMSQYADEILVLIKNNIDSGVICHLGQMCKDSTLITREKFDDEQSKMLCNVIVRVTYDLHITQQKSQNEIEIFLKNDCQKLSNSELIQKCEDLIERYGNNIYGHVVNNMELSKICDKNFLQPPSRTHCDLCTFVLSTTKSMLDANNPEDEVLNYIDEYFCSNLNDDSKKNCKMMIENNGKDLIKNIQQGKQSMLLCTYFQVCYDEIYDKTGPIKKNEIRSFLNENICDNLGIFKESCKALLNKDSIRLIKTLVNDMEGDDLCQVFGICPMKMSFIDNLSINDDTNKCKRCVDDFTRRKYIAEKLLNHSAEFLHHFCGQLPQQDECIKSVDESINTLVQFIQSINPQDICVELKICDEKLLKNIQIISTDNIISDQAIVYIKSEICARIGPLSDWCNHLIDTEGTGLFNLISKDLDPHKVCSVIDICPTTTAFDNCNDKCECCVSKVENYQVKLAGFLERMVRTTEAVCERMPNSNECREVATGFKSNIDRIISNFNAKQICQTFTHCSSSPAKCNIDGDKCECCQNNFNIRETNFRTTVNEISTTLLSFCTDAQCRSNIQSHLQQTSNQIDKINSFTLCQLIGYCTSDHLQRSIPFLSDTMLKTYSNIESSLQDLSDKLCSNFGEFKPICEHIITSIDNSRYSKVYMALLKNDLTIIDNDLHEQSTDTCDGCKNAIQSSKDFWLNSLESVRNVLLQTCDYSSSKDQCRDFINQRFDNLKSYITEIDPEKFCQTIDLCSLSLTNPCSTCIQQFDIKKDAIIQSIDRLAGYFTDLCQKYAEKPCQIYIQQIKDLIQITMEEFDTKQTCNIIGFCTIDGIENNIDFNQYEKNLEDEIETNICSTLGPFETLCKDIIHGNIEDIQALKMNYNIEDLMKIGEELIDTDDLDDNKDKCQCCIARVIRRKRHTKFIGDQIFSALIRSCDRCPVKHECRKHWKFAQARFDERIDKICPKRVCIHLGFCNKSILSHKSEIKLIDNSNSTCILCDYVMNILSNYIHSQSTEEEIEENLKQICNQIPSILQNQCQEYIENYGPTILSILLNDFDLSTICQKLNLCTNQMKYDITHLIKANPITCGVCDYISTYIHFILERNSNEKSFKHGLSTVCMNLSDEQKSKCQIIIQLFSPSIRQLELNPGKNFCKQLTICQTPMIDLKPGGIEIEEEPLISKNPNETPQCTLCHYVISYLDAVLKNNKSEEAVEEAFKKVCSILPATQRDECNQLITTYGPVIAELIAGAADPDTICRYIGVCETSLTTKSTTPLVETPYTCVICQYVVNRKKYFSGLSQDENEILVSLKASCDLYTVQDLQKQCRNFLDQYGTYFSQQIFNDIEPRTACQTIGICDEKYPSTSSTPAPDVWPEKKIVIT